MASAQAAPIYQQDATRSRRRAVVVHIEVAAAPWTGTDAVHYHHHHRVVYNAMPQPVKPRLTEQQARDLRLCYNLIDLDKGGSIDVDELDTAFKVG